MPGRHRRSQSGHGDVDAEEPQRLPQQQADDVDTVPAHAQGGCGRQGQMPEENEDEGWPEQPDEPALKVLGVADPATTQAAPDRDVGEAAGDEEQGHDL
ncbi:MAG TPA: hypothetical protein VIL87_13680 [Dermatophilaceae bacterium]